jgi:hypothetical protein
VSKKTQKTETTQTQNSNQAFNTQNAYGWMAPPDTEDVSAFRDFRPQADPGIAAQFGAERNRLNSSFINPLGGNYSPRIMDAIKRSEGRDISQRESQAFRQGSYDVNQQRQGQLGALAAMTAPRLLQTGSSGTSSGSGTATGSGMVTSRDGLFNDILSGASAGASIFAA